MRYFKHMISVIFNHCAYGGLVRKRLDFCVPITTYPVLMRNVLGNQVCISISLMQFALMGPDVVLTLRSKVNILNFFAKESQTASSKLLQIGASPKPTQIVLCQVWNKPKSMRLSFLNSTASPSPNPKISHANFSPLHCKGGMTGRAANTVSVFIIVLSSLSS